MKFSGGCPHSFRTAEDYRDHLPCEADLTVILSVNDRRKIRAYIDHIVYNDDGGAPGQAASEGKALLERMIDES